MAQPIKKGATIKKKGIAAFKEKYGFSVTTENPTIPAASNASKPQKWLIMPKAFQDATRLPGIPVNQVTSLQGHSNVGKTTLVNHAAVAAQQQGYIPVIIDTENAFSFQYAMNMGFQAEPVYGNVEVEEVDPETGEFTTKVERQIISWEGNFIYYNNRQLCERFGDIDYSTGKKNKTKRTTAVVEDVASAMNELLDLQDSGEIEQGLVFIWDSVGSIGCFREVNSGSGVGRIGNPMWTAAAISAAFNTIVNDRIPSSKKVSSKYDNTLIYVNKIWMDSMSNPVGPATMRSKGGSSLGYSSRLILVLGGVLTSGVKRLTATSKGVNYSYGIETKIKTTKNHLDAPHHVMYEGKLIATDLGFIRPEDLEDYKRTHISEIIKQLNALSDGRLNIKAEDVEFGEIEDDSAE